MNSCGFSPSDEIEKIIKRVRDKSLMAMRMSGNNNAGKKDKVSAAEYLEKLRLLYFSRKCCDN